MRFLQYGLIAALCLAATAGEAAAQADPSRLEGLLIGSLIGDAMGAPTEFAPPDRSAWASVDETVDLAAHRALSRRFGLIASPRDAEPYGPWTPQGPPGTLTDDSRFKILFFRMLERHGAVTRPAFADEILAWHADSTGRHGALPREWLDEFAFAARWVRFGPDAPGALPPERSWAGIPTMAGQMPFLPIAALYPGSPGDAYRAVWEVDFLDNGIGRDLTASLVAGLSHALMPGASWDTTLETMRQTDPFGYGRVPWVPRSVDLWLERAQDIASRSGGSALRLFDLLEEELGATTYWEAWVPITVVVACAALTDADPLATMQLILEFGHDTDSYLQVAGALFGALHGADVFPASVRDVVAGQLESEYGASVEEWLELAAAFRAAPRR